MLQLLVFLKENDAFFVTTNVIITTAQTQGVCPEVVYCLCDCLFVRLSVT